MKPRLFPWKSNRTLLSFPESQITFRLYSLLNIFFKYHISVASTQPRVSQDSWKKSALIFACCCIIFSAKTQQYFFCHSFRWGCLFALIFYYVSIFTLKSAKTWGKNKSQKNCVFGLYSTDVGKVILGKPNTVVLIFLYLV